VWTEVVIGVAGIAGAVAAGLAAPALADRRRRERELTERRAAAYGSCLQRWRQVEAHVRNPAVAEFFVHGERLGELWVLAADVELYGSPAAARRCEEVTSRVIDWAVAAMTQPTAAQPTAAQPTAARPTAAQPTGARRAAGEPAAQEFPVQEIAAFTVAARADLGVGG